MGIRYSLCLITKRQDADLLLAKLGELLDAESRARIGSKKWSPESEERRTTVIETSDIDARGIAGFRTDGESPNLYCLSLQIQLERELESFVRDHHLRCFDRPGAFGCMWTSVFAGDQYALLQMTAATSGMSRVLQRSEEIHFAWFELERKANALFAYVDIEEKIAIQLFPFRGELRLPDYEPLAFEGDDHFSVDRMATFLLATAR